MMTPILRAACCAVLASSLSVACSGDDDDTTSEARASTTIATTQPAAPIIFNGQGNDLAAYASEPPFEKQIVIHHNDDEHPDGLDINAQICFDPDNPRRFVAGEDTHQDTTGEPGWGIFELEGDRVGELSAKQIGKLVPTYQPSNDNPENYGCGFLPDGRIITTDVGNQATGDGDGQLIVWFPPFDSFTVKYCKFDVGLLTGQGTLVKDGYVYVAQARAAVYRYPIESFPTSDQPGGGCDGKDDTGAPLATIAEKEAFIEPSEASGIATPNAIAEGPNGNLFVSSVINGVISEFTADGEFVRTVLKPKAGEDLGAEPFSVGTPLGLAVAPDGNIFYADIGIVVSDRGVGPGDGTGKVRRIEMVDGEPQLPDEMDQGLAFPDGVGIWVPAP
jgi:hypothetical protein